uniref:Uncharacterized protein n=1 Tax=Caenorhabditis japonica TaxID=281687 RepID=A0A8R1DSL0_CAEJA
MIRKWLSTEEWEQIIAHHLYIDIPSITLTELETLKKEKKITIKLPAATNAKMPFDYMTWSKNARKTGQLTKHQPKYVKMPIFGEVVNSIRCVELNQPSVTKHIIDVKESIYVYYAVQDDSFEVPDARGKKRRLEHHESVQLKSFMLPNQTLASTKELAKMHGIEVTSRQLKNLSRGTPIAKTPKQGTPRSRSITNTTINANTTMTTTTNPTIPIKDIDKIHPSKMTYTVDPNNGLLKVTFSQSFPINLFHDETSGEEQEELRVRKTFRLTDDMKHLIPNDQCRTLTLEGKFRLQMK